MKRVLLRLSIAMVLLGLVACESPTEYQDGTYTAMEDGFSNGYRYFIEITVLEGRITQVNYDAISEDGGANKDAKSRAGNYPMVEQGDAQWDWHVQADNLEAYLISSQRLEKPDAVTGATIGIGGFFSLAQQALDN